MAQVYARMAASGGVGETTDWLLPPAALLQYGPTVVANSGKQFRGNQSASNQRAAASAVSSGRVLNAMNAFGAALCTVFTTVSSNDRLFGGSRIPPPITTQS